MEVKASNGSIIKTGDMVLVRNNDEHIWIISIFGYIFDNNRFYSCINGDVFKQCIPLKGNEHLCGTNDEYEEPYTPKFGDKVEGITHTNKKIYGVLIGFSKKENFYTLLEEVSQGYGFTNKYGYCKSVKPI